MLMRAKHAFGSFRTMPLQDEGQGFLDRIIECRACMHTYPRSASPKCCPDCGYVRGVQAEEVPHEFARLTR